MNRPNRVRDGLAGYTVAPPLAWSGWRLRIPGGPIGGQYHGFIGPDSAGWPDGSDEIMRDDGQHSQLGDVDSDVTSEPWSVLWGGTVMREGQDLSDHVYRSSAEMRPRPNASGGAHVIHGYQRRRTAGFAEAPGNYRALGALVTSALASRRTRFPAVRSFSSSPVSWSGTAITASAPTTGATSVVAQPAAPVGPAPTTMVASTVPPTSPAPSPTVAAGPSNFVPSVGQPLPPVAGAAWASGVAYPLGMTITDPNGNLQQATTAGTSGTVLPTFATTLGGTTGETAPSTVVWTMVQPSAAAAAAAAAGISWFSQSTIIGGVENLWVALGAGVALFMLMKKK